MRLQPPLAAVTTSASRIGGAIVGCLVAGFVGMIVYHQWPIASAVPESRSYPVVAPSAIRGGVESTRPAMQRAPQVVIPAPARFAGDPFEAIQRFDGWTTRYLLETDGVRRAALANEGLERVEQRRAALAVLMESDPEAVLTAAIPWAVRSALPAAVEARLERVVGGVGEYRVVGAIPESETTSADFVAIRREALIDGQRYEVFPAGRRAGMPSRINIAMHGVVIDGRMVMRDSPIRVLDPGEPVPAGRTVDAFCGVSGLESGPLATPSAQPVIPVDTGSKVVYLCSAGHIAAFAETLEAGGGFAQGGSVAAQQFVGVTPTTGTKRLLYIRVRFADQAPTFEPQSESSAVSTVEAARDFLYANSGGLLTVEGVVSPVYTLPKSAQWYQSNDTSGFAENVLSAARAVATAPSEVAGNEGVAAFNFLDFDFEAVRYQGGPGSFAGQGYVQSRGVWMKTDSAGVLAHEIGHNLGLWHANAWSPFDPRTIIGSGSNIEYGDVFDSMGSSASEQRHFSAQAKRKLGWLPEAGVSQASGDGIVTIRAHDLSPGTSSNPRAVVIAMGGGREYWLEYRQHPGWGSNRWVANGLGVRWAPWESSNGGTQLLDMTPFTAEGFTDSPLPLGATFSDPVANVHITPVRRTDAATAALDVDVRFGATESNRAPVVTLRASASEVGIGAPATFEVSAMDPDGDALSFAWDAADGDVHASEPRITTSWSGSGQRRVRVVVSDRRGQRTSASVLVRVGNSTTGSIHGEVTDVDGNPVADVRVSNGLVPGHSLFRQAFTDSDGTFVIPDMPAGSWTLAATRPGWMFHRTGFLNPVAVSNTTVRVGFVGLFTGHRISGTVRSADGTAIEGILVSDGVRSERTDASGAFTLTGLGAARHTLTASGGGRQFTPQQVDVRYGDVAGIVFRESVFTVSGEITGVDATTQVTVTDGTRSTTAVPRVGSDGTRLVFELAGVPAGVRTLVAVAPGESFVPADFANPLVVSGSATGLTLQREPQRTRFITGRIVAGAKGVDGVRVMAGGRESVTDRDGRYFITGLAPGNHTVTAERAGWAFVPAGQAVVIVDGSVGVADISGVRTNAAPVFGRLPTVSGAVDGTFVKLSAAATDDGGSALLRYTWSSVGPMTAPVTFSSSGANASADTVCFFGAAGTYTLRVTVADTDGASATADVVVQVRPRAHQMRVEPANARVLLGAVEQFSARCEDQFGNPTPPPSALVWSVDGGGQIGPSGLFSTSAVGERFTVTAGDGTLRAESTFAIGYPPGGGSGISQEVWSGISGGSVSDLLAAPGFPAAPSFVAVLSESLEIAGGMEHNYGQRLRGYFVPPATGGHVFKIASDDASELWLGPTADPGGRVLIASVPMATGVREWNAHSIQRSAVVQLEKGRPVYLEVLHKENATGDHLAVAVELPGGVVEAPIPANRLIPWGAPAFGPPRIVTPARAGTTVVGPDLATGLSVYATSDGGDDALVYRWEAIEPAPGPVAFLPNGSNAARQTMVRFAKSGEYTLRVTIRDTAGQSVTSQVVVRVQETLASWMRTHFLASELDTPALESSRWGPDADPDSDGIPNLLEYAYGLDPVRPGSQGAPVASMVTVDGVRYLAISFRRNPLAADLVYSPQVSSDLTLWQGGMVAVGDGADEWVTYRDTQAAATQVRRFVRVTVTGP